MLARLRARGQESRPRGWWPASAPLRPDAVATVYAPLPVGRCNRRAAKERRHVGCGRGLGWRACERSSARCPSREVVDVSKVIGISLPRNHPGSGEGGCGGASVFLSTLRGSIKLSRPAAALTRAGGAAGRRRSLRPSPGRAQSHGIGDRPALTRSSPRPRPRGSCRRDFRRRDPCAAVAGRPPMTRDPGRAAPSRTGAERRCGHHPRGRAACREAVARRVNAQTGRQAITRNPPERRRGRFGGGDRPLSHEGFA